MKENIILTKSFDFAVRIVNLYKYLTAEKKEYTLAKQILKSGTSIGANAAEASSGQTKKDFIAKMSIVLKEERETLFWLRLLHETDYIDKKMFESLSQDCEELLAITTAIIKTAKNNSN